MGWLPTIHFGGTCMADRDWEAEGFYVLVLWGKLVFEIQLARIDRDFRGEDTDAR